MYVVDLVCAEGHLFEGWYDNRAAFDDASALGFWCPCCARDAVLVRHCFRAVIKSDGGPPRRTREAEAPTSEGPPPMPLELQKALSTLIKHVRAHSEDAGEAFAARALAMHKGDEAPAPIHGTSTPEERETLRDEGVPFVALPIPDIDQN